MTGQGWPGVIPKVRTRPRANPGEQNGLLPCYPGHPHFFRRDYILGMFPYGKPYCLHCGIHAGPTYVGQGVVVAPMHLVPTSEPPKPGGRPPRDSGKPSI